MERPKADDLTQDMLDALGFNVVVSEACPPGELYAASVIEEADGSKRLSAAKITNIRPDP